MKKINVTETFLPNLDDYVELLKEIWESKHLTNRGKLVNKLEYKIQKYLSSKFKPLLVSNGTFALQMAIKALDLKGEIITTPFSYVATTSSIVWEGCKPVFVDIHSEFLTIDETKIESKITKKTSAILATHVYGNPCNVEEIERIAKKHDLKIIYDASHCFGVKYKGKSIFDYGDISTCSFHATKIFHTAEGGAVFCNRPELMKKIFYCHNFGHINATTFNSVGVNAKMNEICAALGLTIIKDMNEVIQKRKYITKAYDSKINFKSYKKLKLRKGVSWNFCYYPILFKTENELLIKVKQFSENNIFPRRYFSPSLNNLPYVEYVKMPISERISKRVLCLPIFPDLTNKEVKKIISFIS